MTKEQLSQAMGEVSACYVGEAMMAAGATPAPASSARHVLRTGLVAGALGLLCQITNGDASDNHLSFVMWVYCREPLDGKVITLSFENIYPIMVCFEGAGLIGQQQLYPNRYNIADPTIVLYDKHGNAMQLERDRAPFGNRAQSGCDNEAGKLWIVGSYETLIDLDALGSIEVSG